MLQQGSIGHRYCMSIAAILGGTLAPVLLMLSPLAVMAAQDCTDWKWTAKAAKPSRDTGCLPRRWPLM
jgi:hypothetical protein